jgi:hypothetical protein
LLVTNFYFSYLTNIVQVILIMRKKHDNEEGSIEFYFLIAWPNFDDSPYPNLNMIVIYSDSSSNSKLLEINYLINLN